MATFWDPILKAYRWKDGEGEAHSRLHSLVSPADHAPELPYMYPVTGEDGAWMLKPVPDAGTDSITRLISGTVVWLGGLLFRATNTVYKIWGTAYQTVAIDKELDAADPLLPRIDLFALNTDQQVIIIKGTPATNPVKPVVDGFTELEFTQVLIPAAATEPGNVVNISVYSENVEWTTSDENPNVLYTLIDFESDYDPYLGSKCVRVEALQESGGMQKCTLRFTTDPAELITEDAMLYFRISSTQAWLNGSGIAIGFKNGGLAVGNLVTLTGTNYGNNHAVVGWHAVVIPMADFGAVNFSVDELEFTFSKSEWGNAELAIRFDEIKLQTGVAPVVDSHTRAHQMDSVLDHPPVAPENRGKMVVTNVVTGAIEYMDIPTGGVTPTSSTLYWDDEASAYSPYATKIAVDPGFGYLYGGVAAPSFHNRMNFDADLYATRFYVRSPLDETVFTQINNSGIHCETGSQYLNLSIGAGIVRLYSDSEIDTAFPIRVGSSDSKNIEVDSANDRVTINMNKVKLANFTALKYLYINADLELEGVDSPGGGVDQIQSDWQQQNPVSLDFIKNKPIVQQFTYSC